MALRLLNVLCFITYCSVLLQCCLGYHEAFRNNSRKIWDKSLIGPNLRTRDTPNNLRKEKFLSIFTLINFANVECEVDGSQGLCLLENECRNTGGTDIGSCARGFGTCCFKSLSCGGSSSSNITWIRNDEYPGFRSSSGTCQYTINRLNSICQLRLDFQHFELSPPKDNANDADNGQCLGDQFTVLSGLSTSTFQYLCGSMPTEWHYYLDVRDVTTPTLLNFFMSASVSQNRRWSIKITQIPCDQYIPQGCGQYFTGTSGTIYSFNYPNGMYLHGMNYGICFRKERRACGYTLNDLGPSWIGCNDLFRIPTNNYPTDSTTFPYCLLPAPASKNSYPATIEQTYNGPLIMAHQTLGPGFIRNFGTSLGKNPGFHMSWQTKTCT